MTWLYKDFDELSTIQLYKILRARAEVFIMEQNCLYLDTDNRDLVSTHIFAMEDNEIAAYCRIMPKGVRYPEISIGRVITTAKFRRTGLGKELMRRAISYVEMQMHETTIRISGQSYLRRFYEELGFVAVSDEYLEDDLPHFEFVYEKK